MRRLTLGVGITLLVLSISHLLADRAGMTASAIRLRVWLRRILSDPWPSVTIAIVSSAWSLGIAQRGTSRLLKKILQLPLWATAAGTVIWLAGFARLFWPLQTIAWDWLFPAAMIAMCGLSIRVLLRGAHEAELNWVSD